MLIIKHIAKTADSAEITLTTGDVSDGKFTAIRNGISNNQIAARQERTIMGKKVVSP